MHIVYQKIVRFPDMEVEGYEALARFRSGESPEHFFARVKQEGKGVQFELKAIDMAIKGFHPPVIKGSNPSLAVNVSASTIIATEGALVKEAGLGISRPPLVLELSEKDEVPDFLKLYPSLNRVRENQALIAIDDMGIGYSGLRLMAQTRPDIVKVDRFFINNINENYDKINVLDGIVTMAKRSGALVVAEGIETELEKEWCIELGVDCGQGYLFGRPEPFADSL